MTLRQKQSAFAQLVARLLQQAAHLGYDLTLGECYRTPEQAALDAAKGIGIVNSLHTIRLAIDLQLFTTDGIYLTATSSYAPLGSWWKAQSTDQFTCCWGGDFSKPDGNHFSLEHNGIK